MVSRPPRRGGDRGGGVESACDSGEDRAVLASARHSSISSRARTWVGCSGLTAPRAVASAAGRRAALGITEADLERAREIAHTVLTGDRVLTRQALLAAF